MSVHRAELVATYLDVVRSTLRGAKAARPIGPTTSLVDSGLIDSFALVDLISRVESILSIRLPTDRLSPGDFDTAELLADRLTELGLVSA